MSLPTCIETFYLGHGLALVHDSAATSFPEGYAVVELGGLSDDELEALEAIDDYEKWWDAVKPLVIDVPDRVLAVLVERVCDVEIGV